MLVGVNVVEKALEKKRAEAAERPPAGSAERAVRFGTERREAYVAELRKGVRRFAAARAVGVDGKTVARARKLDPLFDEECAVAELEGIEPVEEKLMEAALDREPWAVQMVLKGQDRERWGDRKSVDVVVTGKIEVEAGERLARIAELERRLGERLALERGDVIDAEVVE